MKKAIVGALALVALTVAPAAHARSTYITDVFITNVEYLKTGEALVSGGLFSEKQKCRGNREVQVYDYTGPVKRRGAPEPLDTATTSKGGGFGFLVPQKSIGYGVKVKAPKTTKGDDVCQKDSDVYLIF
jgi:hypothetical protein